jgi:aryl carrier-like protein
MDALGEAPGSRRDRIIAGLTSILMDLSGLDADTFDPDASFTDLGFDSLFLTQANAQFRKRFGVRVTLGQLLGETPTISALAARIDAELGPDLPPPVVTPPGDEERVLSTPAPGLGDPARTPRIPASNSHGPSADQVEWLILEQLRVLEEQLDVMRLRISEVDRPTVPTPDPLPAPGGA